MSSSSTGSMPRSAETAIGTRLGRYELLAPIAAGGMAEVFVARALGEGGFQRLVAIKRILPELASDERFVDMFLDEGRLAGLVTSPNVVQVLDVARTDDGALYMVLELVRGVSLHRLLRAARSSGVPLSTPIVVGILAQAADGLAAAHGALSPEGEPMNIVHRDVSPQNILVGIDGRARIADFGIARALHRRSSTDPGELRGKLGYFAPEQIQGRPATARSDVFALSVVAWEALSGTRLFRGETPDQTLRAIRTFEAPALHTLRDDVPATLAAVIARGLAKRAEARIGSAHELASAMRDAMPEASAATIASTVRELVGSVVEELDARIRHALDGAATTMRRSPASRELEGDTDVHTTAPLGADAGIDAEPGTRTLVRPITSPHDGAPAAHGARSRWVTWTVTAGLGASVIAITILLASPPPADDTERPPPPPTMDGLLPTAAPSPRPIETPTIQPTTIDPATIAPHPTTEPTVEPHAMDTDRNETTSARAQAARPAPEAPLPRTSTRVRRPSRVEPEDDQETPTRTGGLRSTEDFARTLRGARAE